MLKIKNPELKETVVIASTLKELFQFANYLNNVSTFNKIIEINGNEFTIKDIPFDILKVKIENYNDTLERIKSLEIQLKSFTDLIT